MTNKSIVWYVIKKEGDVYHVDGYVKGVNIELKYLTSSMVSRLEKLLACCLVILLL